MIKILKASAGSGKTYNLAETYIRLILSDGDPTAYRHILAVTFTNKATDEMKRRILKEFHILSKNPAESPYTEDFVPSIFPDQEALKKKAGDVLLRILHDYGAFAVSTIDRFFQQTLKAFAREVGQFASYQVELDKDSLVSETVDRILDSVSEDDKRLLNWLSDNMMEQLEQGRKPDLKEGLLKMAARLKSDEHRSVVEEYGIDEEKTYSKENLTRLRASLRAVTTGFEEGLREAAGKVREAFDDCGLSPNDTSRGFMGKWLDKIRDTKPGAAELTEAFLTKATDFGSWFRKADQARYSVHESVLAPPAARLAAFYNDGLKAYNTARILLGQIGGLGIASELRSEFQNLLKEKNVLSIDDSNVILRNIIDGSDAPFIYEKLGVRFEHFLLDEFQDTSRVQWDNFKPLIANSDSEGFENLLVGDVKQSIYRWRGSDWKMMARDVAAEFPDAVEDGLKGNWRSLRNIVEFNNDFFAHAATTLDKAYGSDGSVISISSIYGKRDDGKFDRQKTKTADEAKGSLEFIYCGGDAQEGFILETIQKVLEAGAIPGDITVLVRNKKEGSKVASFLMENNLDVISDDSLRLKSSSIVRKLVSMVSFVNNPDDTIGSYLSGEYGIEAGYVPFHSLIDLCERLARLLSEGKDGDRFREETQYIQSFMDYVQDHVNTNGNSLDAFLKAWDEDDPMVSSPSDIKAVRVMTIHKAKGLEFPYVILPYSEKVELFRPENSWSVPKVENTPLEDIGRAAFDVKLSSKSVGTLFEDNYRKELLLQYIDNINTYYVALTRASVGMTVISDIGSAPDKTLSGILRDYLESEGEEKGFAVERNEDEEYVIFRKGELYDFGGLKRKDPGMTRLEVGFPSYQERGRLRLSSESADFFIEERAAALKAMHNGTVLHDILSRVVRPDDLEASVRLAVDQGDLEPGRGDEVMALLSERISAHPEWFPADGAEILNETALFDVDGREWRPDRVVLRDGSVTVIDYKFGEKESRYQAQVRRYAGIYRRLGYKDVSTAIWYVNTDEVE